MVYGGVVFDGRGWHGKWKGCLKGGALAGGGRGTFCRGLGKGENF